MKVSAFALFLTLICSSLFAQKAGKIAESDLLIMKEFEDTIALCGFAVINDSLPETRFGACKKLITNLKQSLKTPNSFRYPFDRLKSVSIQYPADSSFRIFTWQLYVDIDDYRYYGAVQLNTPDLQLIPLIDRSAETEEEDIQNMVLPPDKWYGSLYYNIRQFDSPQGRKYLLFGYDGYSFFNKRKVVEVLTLKDGKVNFGAPVFMAIDTASGKKSYLHRIVKDYSAEASFRLNYDPVYEMIMFDHLIEMGSTYGLAWVPDGTYEGYQLEQGMWVWIENIPYQKMEEAPRPEPVLDQRNTQDVFGKEKKKGEE